MRIMRSASARRPGKNAGATLSKYPPLTEDELAEIQRSRAEAARRALKLAEEMSDEEDARLTAAAESDPDNPPLTEEDWKRMRPAHEVHPELVAKYLRRNRGRPKLATAKEQVTLRIDPDVLARFKKAGAGWQTRINDALRRIVERRRSGEKRSE
jgi:uncharacterized protein (DUF4415 family)